MAERATSQISDSSVSRSSSLCLLIPALLLCAYAAQCLWFIRTQSLTYDEPVHIAEGLDAWRNGRFEQYNDHPPLARLLCTLPLLNSKWQVDLEQLPQGFRVHHVLPDPVSLATRSRLVNVVFGLLLGVTLWSVAVRLFSKAGANLALALFAFSPSLIAHFSVVTTDGAATLFIFVVALQVRRWFRDPSWRNASLAGILLGLLLLAKFSTIPIFLLAAGLMLVLGKTTSSPRTWNWAKTAVALLLAAVVVWAGYFFHVSHLTIHDGLLTATHPNWSAPLVKHTHSRLNISIPVPAGEFIAGLRDLAFHNAHGQRAFFLGHVSATGGWKTYYPVVIALKWPLIVLLLSFAGLVVCFSNRGTISREVWILLSFPALYFVLALFARFNLGERHILPMYPFALLLTAAVAQRIEKHQFAKISLICIALLNAADTIRFAPGYLSYFDILIRPVQSYRVVSDSNLDWGQGLLALRSYQRDHPSETISLAYFGSVDPGVYGIEATPLGEQDRVSGTLVVSATNLSGQYLSDPNAYHWLLAYPPTELLDHSLFVYRLPK